MLRSRAHTLCLAACLAVPAVVPPSPSWAKGAPTKAARPPKPLPPPPSTPEPPAPAPAPAPAAAAPKSPVRPLTLAQVRAAEEQPQPVKSSRIREVKEELDKLAPEDPQCAAKLYELARLHAEQERYYRYRISELTEKVEALGEGEAEDARTLGGELVEARERREQWLRSATQKYEGLTTNPVMASYRRMDQALVALINLKLLARDEENARPLVKRLITDHKDSLSMPDAFLAFAEYFFDAGDWSKAIDFYGRVLKSPESPRYAYARYKLAWAAFFQKDYQQAMKSFMALVPKNPEATGDPEDPSSRSAALLGEECRKAAVWTYAQAAAAEKAWDFFNKVVPGQAPVMMDDLARYYHFLGKHDEVVEVFHELARVQPESAKLCDWLLRGVESARESAGEDGGRELLGLLREIVAANEKISSKESAATKEQKQRCEGDMKTAVGEYVRDWERLTVALAGDELKEAVELYRTWRDEIATRDEKPLVDTIAARLQVQQGKACEAISSYLDLWNREGSEGEGLRDVAARGVLTAWPKCAASGASPEQRYSVTANLRHAAPAVFAHAGDPKDAGPFFRSIDADGTAEMVVKLVEIYEKGGRRKEAKEAERSGKKK